MSRIRIRTPSRLHFGLLAWGPQAPRQFGGVGLMIESPRLELSAEPARQWHAEGPLSRRALEVARRVAAQLAAEGVEITPSHIRVEQAPAEHVGLGVGTQLSLAVTRVLLASTTLPAPSTQRLAALSGRGRRSGIGLHGFVHGGLIVDGGRRGPDGAPPLLSRVTFPPEWAILIVQPRCFTGLHGTEELRAFAELPPIADSVTDRLCRLVLLGLLPAVLEHDLESFGASLTDLQQAVGRCFSMAQGGIYARPELEEIVADLRSRGLHGVGQSSWGPTLYAFSSQPPDQRQLILEQVRTRFHLLPEALFWTKASAEGSCFEIDD